MLFAGALLALAGCQPLDNLSSGSNSGSGTTGTVPNVVGERLSTAQSALRKAGFGKIDPQDATIEHRVVLDSTNWVVVSQSPKAGTKTATDKTVTLKVRKPTDGAGPVEIHFGTVPNVVCMNLQNAQDTLRESGFLNLRSQDGTGQARYQVLDRDWVVIGQSVKAGTKPGFTTRIVLSVVKYGEPTGKSGCAD